MPNTDNKTVVFLMGPTASGKTELGIEISKIIKTRIISVDSALIYRGMDIGTAKPDAQTLAKYPHHLIDICAPEDNYSAHDFAHDAIVEIEKAFCEGALPLLVGGTSFYFNALEHGLSNLPESTAESRQRFNKLLKEKGSEALHRRLYDIDPVAADRIHPNDSQRITRALEVFELSGKTLSALQGNKKTLLDYPIKKIILMRKRELLHQRIEQRFLSMIESGFMDEVKTLKKNPNLTKDSPSMRAVGYRQAWQYLDGETDLETMIEKGIIATRQLCKRQSTWLNAEKDALVLDRADIEQILNWIKVTPHSV